MKRLIILLSIALSLTTTSKAQISLEYTFSGVSAAYINLPVAGYKYYVMDIANSQCRLYNNDHSLWKTINLSIPANYYLYDIQYVTENLFNTDNSLELLYVSYTYNSALSYYTYDTRIVNENGTLLLSVPGAGYSYIYPALNGSKLFVWVYDYSVSPSTVNTQVYTIPGKVSTSVPEDPESQSTSLMQSYPNPARGEVTIPYSLPANVKQAELKLYSVSGAVVKSFIIDHNFDSIQLQTGDLPAGMYMYRIESATYKSASMKLSVSK